MKINSAVVVSPTRSFSFMRTLMLAGGIPRQWCVWWGWSQTEVVALDVVL